MPRHAAAKSSKSELRAKPALRCVTCDGAWKVTVETSKSPTLALILADHHAINTVSKKREETLMEALTESVLENRRRMENGIVRVQQLTVWRRWVQNEVYGGRIPAAVSRRLESLAIAIEERAVSKMQMVHGPFTIENAVRRCLEQAEARLAVSRKTHPTEANG